MIEEAIGALAAILTTVSFIPQAVKVVRTGETEAISLTMYATFTTGIACWGVYGVLTLQWSIIVANAITFVLAAIILAMKLRSVMRAGGRGAAG